MALIVGTNTYVTLEQANAYAQGTMRAATWAASIQQEAALMTAFRALNRVKYAGRPALAGQLFPFPRLLPQFILDSLSTEAEALDGYTLQTPVLPQAVMDAQVEEAIAVVLAYQPSRQKYAELAASGVTAQRQKLGDVERQTTLGTVRQPGAGLLSAEALALLAPYRLGVATIRAGSDVLRPRWNLT